MHFAHLPTLRNLAVALLLSFGALVFTATGWAQGVPGVSPNKCLAGKNKCVNKKVKGLLKCREKCQKSPAKCGAVQADCETKVMDKFDGGANPAKGCFAKLEAKENPAKPDSVCTTTNDTAMVEVQVDTAVDDLVATLEGNPPPMCGDGVAAGNEQCDGADLDGESCATLGYTGGGTLGCGVGCGFDATGCACTTCSVCGNGTVEADEQCDGVDLSGESCTSLGYAGGTLACEIGTCGFDTSACASVSAESPATGQTTCYDGAGNSIACTSTGQDGDIQAGSALAYVDNGDGTVTDLNTGLMWAKKSRDGTMHDRDNCYSWTGTCSGDGSTRCGRDADCTGVGGTCDTADCQVASPNGLTIFEWIDDLNLATFAGFADWRVPNVKELVGIIDYGRDNPAVAPAFDTSCTPGCTVLTCSCTKSADEYWSSTSAFVGPLFAFSVSHQVGTVHTENKTTALSHIRAVRGGL